MQIVDHGARRPRPPADVAGLAVAVQANLVQLKVAQAKRAPGTTMTQTIRVSPPGAVRRFRNVLIDRQVIARYDDASLLLRTHEVWGQFCLCCWFFHAEDPNRPPDFQRLPAGAAVRCQAAVDAKTLELEKSLWRLRFEQRFRNDPGFREDRGFQSAYEAALKIPVLVMGQNVRVCSEEVLLMGSCQFAGMLAAARWIGDHRWTWGQDGIMDLPAEQPL